jgi:hypothetical protein
MKQIGFVTCLLTFCACSQVEQSPRPPRAVEVRNQAMEDDDDFGDGLIGDPPRNEFEKRALVLSRCINLKLNEIVDRAPFLHGAKHYMIEEPPFVLRGISYSCDGMRFRFYIDGRDPMYRNEQQEEWTHEKLLVCEINGIQASKGSRRFNLGHGIPFQFR